MSEAIRRLQWLRADEDEALLHAAICGDLIAPPEPHSEHEWFAPSVVSRGPSVLMLRYENADSAFAFCVAAPASVQPEWIRGLRADLSLEGGERRWSPFVGQLGRYRSVAELATPMDWSESEVRHGDHFWRVRRMRHPAALIDRLSLRDRLEAEEKLRAAFAAKSAAVGVSPQARRGRKVGAGDRRVE